MTTQQTQTPLEALEADLTFISDYVTEDVPDETYEKLDNALERIRTALTEAEALRAILVDVVNKGTDGACLPTATTEFLKSVPIECAAMKAERDALRARVAELVETIETAGDYQDWLNILTKTEAVKALLTSQESK